MRNRLLLVAVVTGLAAITGCSGNRSLLPSSSNALAHPGPGSLVRARSSPPDYMQLALLLTDGSVLTQGYSNPGNWYRYVPDSSGSYSDGTWSQVASLPSGYQPSAFASQVLADGRVLISGGEYNVGGNYHLQLVNLGAIFDPVADTWTKLGHPTGWGYIGDSPSSMLPNGLFAIGEKLTKRVATYDPSTGAWKQYSPNDNKADYNAEEGWTLLPDGSILTADVKDATNSEIFNPSTGKWKSAGSTIVDLRSQSPYHYCLTYGPKAKDCYLPPGEIGPAILRPDGTVFATGSGQNGSGSGTGNTAIYTISTGKWAAGPQFPNGDNAGDNYAALLPNGDVLVYGDGGEFYLWDGSTLSDGGSEGGPPLLLPTGQVGMFGSSVTLYTPTGKPKASWAPKVKSVSSSLSPGTTYTISGTQFNGLSQAMAFGDEFQNATNYPLVRITNTKTGHVFYCRTHGHSTMGVATGKKSVSTSFDVPSSIDSGASTLEVVANGIASPGVSVTVTSAARRRNR